MTGITTAGYGFQQTGIAIAVPKGHPEALAYVTKFIEDAKASGSVRRAMDRAGTANMFMPQPVTAAGPRDEVGDPRDSANQALSVYGRGRGRDMSALSANWMRLRRRPATTSDEIRTLPKRSHSYVIVRTSRCPDPAFRFEGPGPSTAEGG